MRKQKQPKYMGATYRDDRKKGNPDNIPQFLEDCKCWSSKARQEREDKPNVKIDNLQGQD